MATLGIYIQVPFCASKCSFCNFSSRVERRAIYDDYAGALEREIARWPGIASEQGIPANFLLLPVDSVFMGGGTPTLLGAERLWGIVHALRERIRPGADVEFTIETTPGSADVDFLHTLLAMGVNRLSIGAQTFDNRELQAVGRLHSASDAVALMENAHAAGFRNLSLDLIAGLPYQTHESFRHSLEQTVKLRPQHVSLYLFEADEKSRLGREVVHGGGRYHADTVPSDDFMADEYEFGREFLASEGYAQYEISNFALSGFESRHNIKYWQLAPYLGLGAGAHSFDGAHRWSNRVDVRAYMAQLDAGRSPVEACQILSTEEQVEEFFFLGLRQACGVDLNLARERWGAGCLERWADKLAQLWREGLLICEGECMRLPPKAYVLSNEIFQEFVATPA